MDYFNEERLVCMVGTWAWGTGSNGSRIVFGHKYPKEQLRETFEAACDKGICLWDTAEVYGMGEAERILGDFIKGKNDVLISTKFHANPKYKKGEAREALKKSMERLGVEKVDIYWLHRPYNIRENMLEIAECAKEGKVKKIGISNCNAEELKEAIQTLSEQGIKLYAVQNHYSLLSMERQKEVYEYCRENDIIFFGYMVLEQGALSGHYDEKNPLPRFSYRGLVFGKKKFRKISKLLDLQRELAVQYDVDASQIPIAWTIAKGVVPIVGLTQKQHANELFKGINVKLTQDEINQLEKLALESGVTCKGSWEK